MTSPPASMTRSAHDTEGPSFRQAGRSPRHSVMFNPTGLVRQRFRQWWQARLPLTDTLTLSQRNVYILPTRP